MSAAGQFSLFQSIRDYELAIRQKNKDIEDLENEIKKLKAELRNQRALREKYAAVEDVYKEVLFENKKLRNELTDSEKLYQKKDEEYKELTLVQKLKDSELEELKENHRTEFEAVEEFIEAHAALTDAIYKYREARQINDRQIKALQFRRDHLQSRLDLIQACFESETQSSVLTIPTIPFAAKLVADPEEVLPKIFFTFIESLTQRLQTFVTNNNELVQDKQYMLDALDDELHKLARKSFTMPQTAGTTFYDTKTKEGSIIKRAIVPHSKFDSDRKQLKKEKEVLENEIRNTDLRRLHEGKQPTGLLKTPVPNIAAVKAAKDFAERRAAARATTRLIQEEQGLGTQVELPQGPPTRVIGGRSNSSNNLTKSGSGKV